MTAWSASSSAPEICTFFLISLGDEGTHACRRRVWCVDRMSDTDSDASAANESNHSKMGKFSVDGENDRVRYGLSSMQGRRATMEDAHAAYPVLDVSTSFFGVYDGHGGKVVAKFCAKYLHQQVLKNEAYAAGDIVTSLQQAFFRMDEMMRGQRGWRELAILGKKINKISAKIEGLIWGAGSNDRNDDWAFEEGPHSDFAGPTSGSTACVAVIRNNQLIVANAGDSRCVLSRNGQAYNLSRDHKPHLENEKERILKAGGFIHAGQVNGTLHVARAIGDSNFKQNRFLPAEKQIITANPDINTVELCADDDFVALACNGIWDCMSSQQLVEFVHEQLRSETKLSAVCERLLDYCSAPCTLGTEGCGNMTIILVKFKKPMQTTTESIEELSLPYESADGPLSPGNNKLFSSEITFSQMDAATSPAPVDFLSDEEEKENQIAEREEKIEPQEMQAGDQGIHSIVPSKDVNMSVKENKAQELPVQSNTVSTSVLPLTPPPKLEASVNSAKDGSLASSNTPLESAYPSLSQNSDPQCGITLDRNGQSSLLTCGPPPPPPPPPPRSCGASSSKAIQRISSDPSASAPSTTRLDSTLLNEEVLDLPNDSVVFSPSGAQVEQLVPSFQQFQHAIFTRTIIEPQKLQAVKQKLFCSLEMSQDVISGVNMEFPGSEEGVAPVSEEDFEVNSISSCAFLLPSNGSNVEATAVAHNPAQVPEMMLLHLEEPYQVDDSPSSASMSSGYDYDVFLSFRGPDTRSGIVDFLYTSLLAAGIHTYRDDEELRVGDEIGLGLQKAISHSKISIPIFSKGYSSSKWCLNELVQMVECWKTRRQKIMPIFYNVTPSEVRHQTGLYGEAFALHEKQFDNEVVSKWKAALKEAGELKGWDIDRATNRREGELVKLIVRKVVDELKKAYLLVTDCLVGVENHVKEINRIMCADSEDIQVLGIYGLGGVGKTTLAKIIYNQLSHRFEDCCFLSDIRKTSGLKGIECLQNQLISDILKRNWSTNSNVDEGIKTIKERLSGKKVLVLLDDVDERTHLNLLMGKPAWFGLGSRIIITSRNKDVVDVPSVTCTYELVSMDFNQSLELFCKHAFGSDYPPDEYDAVSTEVVKTTGGLPLALEVIGSLLSGKRKDVWGAILKKLRKIPCEEVKRKLKISYDALDDWQKHIFLDIACLFVGFDIRIVLHMWNATNLFPGEGLRVLQQMSLIKIGEDNKLWMHDQLRVLGRDIVRQECNMEMEKQTRLWDHEEALDIVMKKKGTTKIEALSLKFDNQLQCYFAIQEIEMLSNLKYLEVRVISENWPSNGFPANVEKHLPILSELRWLSWHHFPPELKLTNFSMKIIVILDLSWSKFSESWDGWTCIKMARNLKVLNLTGCAHLHTTPDFSANANLEHLILENCARLVQIDKSIGHLKQLVFLNLRFCIKLCKLPEEICYLESLKELLIDGTSIREIPEWRGMKTLETLSASDCLSLNNCRSIGHFTSILRLSLENVAITQLLPEIGELVKLEHLSLCKCKLLRRLPDSIGNLESLVLLNLSYTHVAELPDSLGKLKNLKVLRMCGSIIRIIPSAVGMLEKLEEIDAEFCQHLEGAIPDGIGRLLCLRVLKLSNTRISQVPRLPESLISLQISTQMNTIPDLSNLTNLIDLDLDIREVLLAKEDCIFVESSQLVQYSSPWWIGTLCYLESLKLSCDTIIALHKDIGLLSQLKKLELLCSNLQFLPSLPSSLTCLQVKSSRSMETLINLSKLTELSELRIDSSVVTGIQGLYGLENLKILDFRALNSLERLPDMSNLKKLSELHLQYCHNLIDVQSISGLGNLRILKLIETPLLERLPDLSNLKKLTELHLWDCHCLTEILSFEGLENLMMLKLGELPLLERLPDLSILMKLTKLHIQLCQSLVEIRGKLDSLEDLCIEGCKSLVEVPNPSSFKKLKSLHIRDCQKLYLDKLHFLDLEIPDREYGNSTCLILSKIGFCVCQLGKQFFLPSFSS